MKIYYIGLIVLLIILLIVTMLFFFNKNKEVSSIEAKAGDNFELKIGQTAFFAEDNLKIKFLDVVEDSRCPKNSHCVWLGQVLVKFNVEDNGKNLGDFTTENKGDALGRAYFNWYSLELIKMLPERETTQEIKKSDYTATFVVYKNIE